jgi:hypothetical protein
VTLAKTKEMEKNKTNIENKSIFIIHEEWSFE